MDSQIVALRASAPTRSRRRGDQVRRAGDPQGVRHRLEGDALSKQRRGFRRSGDEAGRARKGRRIISAGYLKEPTDPQTANTPEYKEWLDWMKKYNPAGNLNRPQQCLRILGRTNDGRRVKSMRRQSTRENVMKQAASSTTEIADAAARHRRLHQRNRFAPIKQMQLMKFDGIDLAALRRRVFPDPVADTLILLRRMAVQGKRDTLSLIDPRSRYSEEHQEIQRGLRPRADRYFLFQDENRRALP